MCSCKAGQCFARTGIAPDSPARAPSPVRPPAPPAGTYGATKLNWQTRDNLTHRLFSAVRGSQLVEVSSGCGVLGSPDLAKFVHMEVSSQDISLSWLSSG